MAVDAVRGEKTLAELAKLHDVHPNQITDWKNQLLARAAGVFGAEASRSFGSSQAPTARRRGQLCIGITTAEFH